MAEDDLANISAMFPDVDRGDIQSDLLLTQDANLTINRILDDQLSTSHDVVLASTVSAGPSAVSNSSHDSVIHHSESGDDDDLPDLCVKSLPPLMERIQRQQNSMAKEQLDSPKKIHTISDTDSDENKCTISKSTNSHPSKKPQKSYSKKAVASIVKASADFSSDSEDNDVDSHPESSVPADVIDVDVFATATLDAVTTEQRKSTEELPEPKISKQNSIKQIKDLERETKRREREMKRKMKALEADRRRALVEQKRKALPTECSKFVSVVIDSEIIQRTCGSAILTQLQTTNFKYEIQKQALPHLITFYREVTDIEDDGEKLTRRAHEQIEEDMVLCLPVSEFVVYTHAYQQKKQGHIAEECASLTDFVNDIKKQLPGHKITLIVQGLEQHFREQKVAQAKAAKAKTDRGRNQPLLAHLISRVDVQEVVIDVQMQCRSAVIFVEDDAEVAKSVLQIAKAVAEIPFKRSKQNDGFDFPVERHSVVKLNNTNEHETLWRLQIQQFKGIGAETANAIIARYRTPRALWQAYKACSSTKQAERLLEDIVVRRGYGTLATERRVGIELSKRMYMLLTENNNNVPIE